MAARQARLHPAQRLEFLAQSNLYLPTQAGIPAEDKRQIKRWLDWGRANINVLFVRKDLTDWPAPGKVDGSAHIVGNSDFVFLFNPNQTALAGQFALESLGCELFVQDAA